MHATEDLGSARHGWETPVSATRAAVAAQPQHGDGRTAPALPAPCSAPPRPPCQALPAPAPCTSTPCRPSPPRAVHLHDPCKVRASPVPCDAHPTGGGGPCAPRGELIQLFRIIQVCFCFLHVRLFNIYIRGAHTPPAQPSHRCQAGRSGTPPVTKARRRPRVHRNMFRNLQSGPSSCPPAPH